MKHISRNVFQFVIWSACLVFGAFYAQAQTFNYANFASVSGLNLTGNAVQSGNVLRLTTNAVGQQGAAFYNTQVGVNAFTTTFQFRIADLTGGGADGFSFNVRQGGAFLENGAAGEAGTNEGLAVQFDTFQNANEPSSNFIRLRLNGTTRAENASLPINLKDGAIHTVLLSVAASGQAILLLDGTQVINANNINLSGQSPAFVGFGARTGGSTETHDILSWTFAGGAAVQTVTKTADTNDGVCDSDCSLREAIAAATPTGGMIQFASPLFDSAQTITLANGELTLNKNLTIFGRGANLTTVSGNNASRVFINNGNFTVTINGLTITGGRPQSGSGGGISNINGGTLNVTNCIFSGNNVTTGNGGGIYNLSTLNITNTIFSGNLSNGGGAISTGSIMNMTNSSVINNSSILGGGGIINGNIANVINSTISGNFNTNNNANGGGIFTFGNTMNLINSTVSNNSVGNGIGGGIYINGSPLNLTNSTVNGNSVVNGNGGGVGVPNTGGTVNARNTIISGNTAPINPELNVTPTVNENNLIGGASLAPLGFYGGQTLTHALLSNATNAINQGNNCVLNQTCATFNAPIALPTDQRGAARVGQVDIGAFELNNSQNGGNYRALLPFASQGLNYSFQLSPNNGTATYQVSGGTLPNGVNLSTNFAPNAVVSLGGVPTQSGFFDFSVTVNSGGNTNVTDYRLGVIPVTSANVSVSGRILTNEGEGLRNAIVLLTEGNGNTRKMQTGSFGNYRFDELAVGQTYIIQVVSKRFTFAPQTVYLTDNVTEMNFTAQ